MNSLSFMTLEWSNCNSYAVSRNHFGFNLGITFILTKFPITTFNNSHKNSNAYSMNLEPPEAFLWPLNVIDICYAKSMPLPMSRIFLMAITTDKARKGEGQDNVWMLKR